MKSSNYDVVMFDEYLKNKISPSTRNLYTSSLRAFLKYNPDIDILESYNNFIIKHSIEKRSVYPHFVLRHYIEFKIEDKNLKKKLIDGLIKPRERHDFKIERRHLKVEEALLVVNSLEKLKHKIIAIIQIMTGARAGDVLRTKRPNIRADIYQGQEVIKLSLIGKGRKKHVVTISDETAMNLIIDYITSNYNHDDYYFLELSDMKGRDMNKDNEELMVRMNYRWYWSDLKQALNSNGYDMKDFATHDFRRGYARRVWDKWKDVNILQNLLNHKDPKVTLRYLQQSGLKNIDYHIEIQKDL